MTKKDLQDWLDLRGLDVFLLEGFAAACIGFRWKMAGRYVAVYDEEECVEIIKQTGMSHDEAIEFFNHLARCCGDMGPIFVETI